MICEKCGKELESLEVNHFNQDGSDDWYDTGVEINGEIVSMTVLPNWTGNELTEEEQIGTIRCPHCHQFPFKQKMVDAYPYVTVIMYPHFQTQMDAEVKEE